MIVRQKLVLIIPLSCLMCVCTVRQISANSYAGIKILPININLFNLRLNLNLTTNLEETLKNDRICESYIKIRVRDNEFEAREKPKGSCYNCCPVKENDVRLMLYRKSRPNRGVHLPHQRASGRKRRSLEKDVETVVFVHGFLETSPGGSGTSIKNAYLSKKEAYNVILLDWAELVSAPWYVEAVDNVKMAGKILAKFLETYSDQGELQMSKLHLIGFSLGAHVVGFAGKFLRKDLRIRRITGLDPAYPGFAKDESQRLSRTDADFVDVVHTDTGNFGYPYALGHVDFYPNGGTYFQPGCGYQGLQNHDSLYDIFSCSHLRAWRYYAESVRNPWAFPAIRCSRWSRSLGKCLSSDLAYMGFLSNKNDSGKFYLKTRDDYPYGLS